MKAHGLPNAIDGPTLLFRNPILLSDGGFLRSRLLGHRFGDKFVFIRLKLMTCGDWLDKSCDRFITRACLHKRRHDLPGADLRCLQGEGCTAKKGAY